MKPSNDSPFKSVSGKPTNAEIKLVISLKQKKYRDLHSLFVIEGEKLLDEATKSGVEIIKTILRDEVGETLMARLSSMASPPPVLAVAKASLLAAWSGQLEAGQLYLGLDRVSDPGNLGTIIRLAEWFGVRVVFLGPFCAEPYNPKVIQASMGSLFRVRLVQIELKSLLHNASKQGIPSFGAVLGGLNIYKTNLQNGGLLLMGNESHGLAPELIELVDCHLSIPSFAASNQIDSLNVATATAVMCAEFRRQSSL